MYKIGPLLYAFLCVHLCLCGPDSVCIILHISECYAVFIEVIHAGVIEGNHFTAKLYCNYGDERLLFIDTNTEW